MSWYIIYIWWLLLLFVISVIFGNISDIFGEWNLNLCTFIYILEVTEILSDGLGFWSTIESLRLNSSSSISRSILGGWVIPRCLGDVKSSVLSQSDSESLSFWSAIIYLKKKTQQKIKVNTEQYLKLIWKILLLSNFIIKPKQLEMYRVVSYYGTIL